MKLKRFVILGLLIPFLALQGCSVNYQAKPRETPKFIKNAFSTYEVEAFGVDKSYAIVTISADSLITKTQGTTSLSGLVKAASEESGYWNKSERVFKETTPMIKQEFQRSNSFWLIPETSIVSSPDYQAVAADESAFSRGTMIVADNYKFIKDKDKLGKLATALDVDGVIVLHLRYGYAPSGANYNGLISVGSQHAAVTITAHAVDRNGKTVWKGSGQAFSDELIDQSSVGESVNFKKLHPHLVATTRKATDQLLKELEQKIKVAAN